MTGPTGAALIPALIFDQFEEVFTFGLGRVQNRDSAQAFLSELADLIENRCPDEVAKRLEEHPDLVDRYDFAGEAYRLVLALREDFVPALEAIRERAPSLGRNDQRLLSLNGSKAYEAVVGPGGALVTAEVARAIVKAVASERKDVVFAVDQTDPDQVLATIEVEPALLSLFCRELNERRLERKLDAVSLAMVSEGETTILDTFYERSMAGKPDALRDYIEGNLVESGVRENVSFAGAKRRLTELGVPTSDLDALVNDRILHVIDRPEGPRIELSHDVLIQVVERSRLERAAKKDAEEQTRTQALALRRRFRQLQLAAGAIVVLALLVSGVWLYLLTRQAEIQNADLAARQAALNDIMLASDDLRDAANGTDARGKAVNPAVQQAAAIASLTKCQDAMGAVAAKRPTIDNRASLALCEYNLGNSHLTLAKGAQGDARQRELDQARAALGSALARFRGVYGASLASDRAASARYADLTDYPLSTLAAAYETMDPPRARDAAAARTDEVNFLNEALARQWSKPVQDDLVNALGGRSWDDLLAGDFSGALADAKAALARDPSQTWILVNEAHAELLLGQIPAAKADYLKVLASGSDRQTQLKGIEVDFDTFRKANIGGAAIDQMQQSLAGPS